ncbi:MAG: polysaccharide biosynthesis protein [Catenisphaera adipataccumulans]|jgi:FlaA1/EpsC-like NDP-sugar epimerase|uniref:polysaccharide biosynthesis protein n=1 Tax=Catenisphaera adipataccumulans TaxID=700500 RepID=UPI003D8D739A
MEGLYKSKLYQNYRGVLISLFDLMAVFLSYVFVFFMDNNFFLEGKILHITPYIIYGMIFVLVLHLISQILFRTHKTLWMYTGPNDVVRYGLSTLFCMVIMLGFTLHFHLFHVSLIFMAETLAFLIIMGSRLLYRSFNRHSMDVDRKKNALIIGAGNAGYIMMNEIYRNKRYPFNVVGFLDDYKKKGTLISGKPVLGTVEEVASIAKEYQVDQLFIAMSSVTREQKRHIIELCTDTSINTKIMSFTLENDEPSNVQVEDIKIEDLLNRPSVDLKIDEIGSYITDKAVCVTGAGGSIGSELCRQIVHFHPRKLVMIDINENTLYMLEQEFMRDKRNHRMAEDIEILSLIVSIREREEINKVMAYHRPDVVYHAAAHKHVPLMETRPSEAILNNVFGTKNVIDACIENGVSRFIMISTDKAVNPTNVMGATKRMTELIMQSRETKSPIKMAAVRFGNVLGSNGSVIPIFKEQIKQGGPVTVTDKNVQRYFMTIPEAAQLVMQAGYYAKHREIFVLDMGKPVKIWNLAEKMIRLSGYVPGEDIEIKEIGLRPGEKMFEELSLEIEKCHRTDNDLIFVHEPVNISQSDIDARLKTLRRIADDSMDPKHIKEILLETIKCD